MQFLIPLHSTLLCPRIIKLCCLLQPKTRANVPSNRYGSLPNTNPGKGPESGRFFVDIRVGRPREINSRTTATGASEDVTGEDSEENRTVLGIGISAVHDAVLRGVAKIPGNLF